MTAVARPAGGLGATLDRAGLVVLASAGLLIGLGYAAFNVEPYDTTLFWSAAQRAHYYGQTWAADPSSLYVYPPPLAQVLGAVPWVPYLVVWTTILGLAFWAATRSWSLLVVVISTVGLILLGPDHLLANPVDLTMIGNPQIILAAVCLLGFRYPALWSLALLTKISPGIGILWFAVRREWRSLGIALGATALIAGVSLLLAPGAWVDFFRFATANVGTPSPNPIVPVPFLVRLPMSALLITWGARTDRRWTVPIAVGWASLALYESTYITVWIAALPLLGRDGDRIAASARSLLERLRHRAPGPGLAG